MAYFTLIVKFCNRSMCLNFFFFFFCQLTEAFIFLIQHTNFGAHVKVSIFNYIFDHSRHEKLEFFSM